MWLSAYDAAAWTVAFLLAGLSRMEFITHRVDWGSLALAVLAATVLFFLVGSGLGLHVGRARLASLEEMISLGIAASLAGAVTFICNLAVYDTWGLPRSVPLSATGLALGLMAWSRAAWRRADERSRLAPATDQSINVVVFGAGDAGKQLVKAMRRDPRATYRPVALIDDDTLKAQLRIDGVAVQGASGDIARVAAESGASTLIIAIPSMAAREVRRASQAALAAGLDVKVLPGVGELLEGRVGVADVRDINLADLLGRRQIDTDLGSIAGYLTVQRVLVTGAGGSIGSELCRQVAKWGPAELIMLDRDESALHAAQLSIYGQALLDDSGVVLADIRDEHSMTDIFQRRRPDVVFHAAALKHLPMLQQYPGEAVRTNVWGTSCVLEAAKRAGVKKFVNISTDKAANPESVLGYSKRIAEGLTAAAGREAAGTYLSVRFGNVLGSRGSVLAAFTAQIAAGGPVTVTHPDVTRYFMTVEEAVQLVIQAAAIGRDGEALVLDMGDPVRIDDVARQLIELSRRQVEIQYTGLRQGEKMHEDLFGAEETDRRLVHPLVSHVDVPPRGRASLLQLDPWSDSDVVLAELVRLCAASPVRADG